MGAVATLVVAVFALFLGSLVWRKLPDLIHSTLFNGKPQATAKSGRRRLRLAVKLLQSVVQIPTQPADILRKDST